jgi:hypothetical protein
VFKAAGFTMLHDFGHNKDNKIDTNNLKVEYFMTANNVAVNERLNTVISFGQNDHSTQRAINTSASSYNGKIFNAEYDKKFDHSNLYASYNFCITHQAVSVSGIVQLVSLLFTINLGP